MPSANNMHDSDDEFVVIEDNLPIRPKSSNNQSVTPAVPKLALAHNNGHEAPANEGLSVRMHRIQGSNNVLMSVQPPLEPEGQLRHTNCDIVLVIDVSGSMGYAAELPDNIGTDKQEVSGLHILDLVRHAARTIVESLGENDRLAIVTFSNDAKRVQDLLPMTAAGKASTWARLEQLQLESSTNLWSGIREGLDVFTFNKDFGNVQNMFILTDGAPNYMCPSQGYVKKLQPILKEMETINNRAPTLSTFGFGYHLKSDLMRSIAEVGRGSYAFIPDSGMIGTVFVHAVANLFATFATGVKLRLETEGKLAEISSPEYLEFETEESEKGIVINLERLQYGQSRDIVVRADKLEDTDILSCSLEYQNVTKNIPATVRAQCKFGDHSEVSQAYIDYHFSRHQLCKFLTGFSTRNKNNEHVNLPATRVENKLDELEPLVLRLKTRIDNARKAKASVEEIELLQSILDDIENPDSSDNPHGAGQISLAIQTKPPVTADKKIQPAFYDRWGRHYLPSVLHAHMRQQCATFKDEGPLRYGSKSPLFIKSRDDLDRAFDKLPAPKPSLQGQRVEGGVLNMSRFHSRSNPCFAGSCKARAIKDGEDTKIRVGSLQVGDMLWTPAGGRKIREIVKTDVAYGQPQLMLSITSSEVSNGNLWITPYHPIQLDNKWVFPNDADQSSVELTTMTTGFIYSILLEKDKNADAHIIDVGGILCVTLGHGITSAASESCCESNDVRVHPYFGDYDRVLSDLERLDRDNEGRRISGGVARDAAAELAMRFMRPDELQAPVESSNVMDRLLTAWNQDVTRLFGAVEKSNIVVGNVYC